VRYKLDIAQLRRIPSSNGVQGIADTMSVKGN